MTLRKRLLELAKPIVSHPSFQVKDFGNGLSMISGRDVFAIQKPEIDLDLESLPSNTEELVALLSSQYSHELSFHHFQKQALADPSLREHFLVYVTSTVAGDYRNGDPRDCVSHEGLYFAEQETNDLVRYVFAAEDFGHNDFRSVRTGLPLKPENNTPERISHRRELALAYYAAINKEKTVRLRTISHGGVAGLYTDEKPPRKWANEWGERLWAMFDAEYTWHEPNVEISKMHSFTKANCLSLARRGCFSLGGYGS